MSIDTSILASTFGLGLDLNNYMDQSELSRGFGTLMSNAFTTAGDSMFNNLLKGLMLTQGLQQDVANSIMGSAVGLAANGIGQGINALGGNSRLSRGIGQGVSTGLGTIGGTAVNNLLSGLKLFSDFTGAKAAGLQAFKTAVESGKNLAEAGNAATKALKLAKWNSIGGLGMLIVGSGLSAAFGPSKEYGGTYGNITKTMDSVYDIANSAVNFVPGWGLLASGIMTLNKGLSNVFGSTSGMTKQDAILGSAFMPAPVKWLNMAGAKTTSNFEDLSWLNTEKATDFMGSSFGNLNEKFERARKESGKTYGTFSRGAYKHALRNLDFANPAWLLILAMADLNELLNIRSQYMSSINNQRYAQMIQGAWLPTYRGKQGMKILNNATNHKVGMRLLSGAALIDDKQMILSALTGTKFSYSEEKLDDWFPNYENTASTFGNMMKNLSAYFLKHKPDYEVSKYKPATSSNPNAIYYTIPNLKYDVVRNLSKEYLTGNPLTTFEEVYNDNKFGNLREMSAVNLGRYKVSAGLDQNGRYISFYDKYDWNILESLGLGGQPFEIYDRIYEKEWPTLYNKSK